MSTFEPQPGEFGSEPIHSAPVTPPTVTDQTHGPSIESLVIRMKSYSLIVLPFIGFILGQLLQFALGTRNNRQFESIMVHLITVILLVFISASILTSDHKAFQSNGDRIFCIGVSYLFVLAVVLGIISVLF